MSVEWPTLLREISAHLLDDTRDDPDAREITWLLAAGDDPGRAAHEAETRSASRWLGFPGASEADIAARERALGVKLPGDYRAFLRASNGYLCMSGFPNGISTLSPVQDIGWLRDRDPGRLKAYAQGMGSRDPDDIPDEWYVLQEDFENTLLIGESDGNECILLKPPGPGLQLPNWNQWEVWLYDPEVGFDIIDDSPNAFLELMSRPLTRSRGRVDASTGYELLALVDATRPSVAALRERIDALDAEALAQRLADLVDAAAEVRVKWEGPFDPSLGDDGQCWSEDSTEDLVDWIVAQGTVVWRAARGATDEALLELARTRDAQAGRGQWEAGTPDLRGMLQAAHGRLVGDRLAIFRHLEQVLAARSLDRDDP